MSALAHARGTLHFLHPDAAAAKRAWSALAIGVVGLLSTTALLDNAEFGDRLFAAMWLLFAASGLHGLRQACWTPQGVDMATLPIGRVRRNVVEIATYTALITALTVPFVLVLSTVSSRRFEPVAAAEPGLHPAVEGLLGLAVVVLLLVPLLAAAAPGSVRRGPASLLRLLLPWLPLGIAATAGWLAEPTYLGLTLLAMVALATTLLALRRTGWEDWWPTLPDLFASDGAQRPGLAPLKRLGADFVAGLGHGLGIGVLANALAWAVVLAVSRGAISSHWTTLALLLISGSFLYAIFTAVNLPIAARAKIWRSGALPWAMLPLPHGAMQRRIHSGQAAVWLVLALIQMSMLWLTYQGLGGDRSDIFGAEFTVGILLACLPIAILFEAINSNASRKPAAWIPFALGLLGFASFMAPLVASTEILGAAGRLIDPTALTPTDALLRTLAVAGPAFLIGLAWLAAGRLLVLRDIARQRAG